MMRIRLLESVPYHWVVVGLCVVTTLAIAYTQWGFGVLFPLIREDLEISRAELGLLTSGWVIGGTATALLMGWLVDVVGVRQLMTVSLTALAVMLLLFSQVQSLLQAVLVSLLIGVSYSATFPSWINAIMGWVPPRDRGRAMGIIEGSIPIGGIVATLFLTALAIAYGWRSSVMVLALMTVVSSTVFFSFYRNKPRSLTRAEGAGGLGARVLLVAKNRDIWLLGCCGALQFGPQMVILSYLVLFLKEHQGMSAVEAGGLLAVAMAGGAIGRVAWGLVSDLLLGGRRVATLAAVGILSMVSMAVMVWLPGDSPLVVAAAVVFLVGAMSMGWSVVWAVVLAELADPGLIGISMGFANTVQRVGSFGIAPLFGLIVDVRSYDMGWWMAAGLAGAGVLLLGFLRPETRRR